MARLDRKVRTAKAPSTKVMKRKTSNDVLKKLAIGNILLTTVLGISQYDKYVELFKIVVGLLGY